MQFKVLRGIHSDGGRLYAPLAHDGSPTPGTVGDTVETDTDLVRKHGAVKFKQIHNPEPVDELDGMTITQLMEYAETLEIDLSGAKRKAEIIQTIRAAENPDIEQPGTVAEA